jgi:hypothetical protein
MQFLFAKTPHASSRAIRAFGEFVLRIALMVALLAIVRRATPR